MSSIIRNMKRHSEFSKRLPMKCCGKHLVVKKYDEDEITSEGLIHKVPHKALVCPVCGKGRRID